jgi:chaperone modulatory protein CbpM
MIGMNVLIAEIEGMSRPDLQRWIDNDWVRPSRQAGAYVFYDIDVERIRLIQELRHGMQIDEDALPVVLKLLDQLYELRRRMHALGKAIERTTTGETRRALARHLTSEIPE